MSNPIPPSDHFIPPSPPKKPSSSQESSYMFDILMKFVIVLTSCYVFKICWNLFADNFNLRHISYGSVFALFIMLYILSWVIFSSLLSQVAIRVEDYLRKNPISINIPTTHQTNNNTINTNNTTTQEEENK